MYYAELCDKFCEIELKYDLFSTTFNDVAYWKYARYYVYRILLNKFYCIHTPWLEKENETKIKKFSHTYQRLSDILFHNISTTSSKDILMFTFNRRAKKGKTYISSVTDEIALNLELSKCIVEVPYHGGYYRPTPIKGIKYFDPWKGVGRNPDQYSPITRGKLHKQILLAFEHELAISFSRDEKNILVTNINYFIMYRQELMANYEKVIQKIHPRLVVLTTSYIGEWVVLIETLKQLGIPSAEIIHGYVDNNYLPYNYAEAGMNDAQPDYIFIYSKIQKEIVHWGIPRTNIRVVGYPEGEKRSKELLARRKNTTRSRICIISSMMQPIEKYVNSLVDHLDPDKYEILFKLHPNEYSCWRDIYPNISDKICIIDNNEKDIHYYLANSDIVIGINSTALFEATFYPVKIFILEEESHENMDILIRTKRALLVHSREELISCISNGSGYQDHFDNPVFQRNAIENINREITNIISKERKPNIV